MDWRVKVAIQTALSLTPWAESLNFMAQRANGSFAPHHLYRGFSSSRDRFRAIKARMGCERPVVVEIGTGWAGVSIVAMALEGAGRIYSFDSVRHFRLPLAKTMLDHVVKLHPEYADRAAPLLAAADVGSFMRAANAEYRAPGDAARTGLPDKSVDLVFSQSVLEHVRPADLEHITRESARILRGRAHHHIALCDHLTEHEPNFSGIHFLSHSPLVWWLRNNRINYHNRWRAPQFIDLFTRCGGRIVHRVERTPPRDREAARTMGLPVEAAISHLEIDVVFDGHGTSMKVM